MTSADDRIVESSLTFLQKIIPVSIIVSKGFSNVHNVSGGQFFWRYWEAMLGKVQILDPNVHFRSGSLILCAFFILLFWFLSKKMQIFLWFKQTGKMCWRETVHFLPNVLQKQWSRISDYVSRHSVFWLDCLYVLDRQAGAGKISLNKTEK